MIRPIVTAGLLALAGLALPAATPLVAQSGPAHDDLQFTLSKSEQDGNATTQIALTRSGSKGHFASIGAADFVPEQAIAVLETPGAPVTFSVAREAGTLACTGRVFEPGKAMGKCRFDADREFTRGLAAKGLVPEDDDDLLGATLVDARISQVEDLERLGYKFGEFGEVIAVAALNVSPEFAQGLRATGLQFAELENLVSAKAVGVSPGFVTEMRAAGLRLEDEEDIVSAKAVGVDKAWLAGMARVGYADLSADQAIQLKAMDITPEYAERMERVLAAVGE